MSWFRNEVTDVAIAVSATETTLAEIDVDDGIEAMAIAVKNTGAAAFDAFSVWVSVNGVDYVEVDAATPDDPVNWVVTDLATLAAAAVSTFQLDVRGIAKVKLTASANAVATTASAWSGQV